MRSQLNRDTALAKAEQKEKGPAPDARPANFQMVAGVRFELLDDLRPRVARFLRDSLKERQPDSSRLVTPTKKKKAGRLMPGLRISKWLRGSDLN